MISGRSGYAYEQRMRIPGIVDCSQLLSVGLVHAVGEKWESKCPVFLRLSSVRKPVSYK